MHPSNGTKLRLEVNKSDVVTRNMVSDTVHLLHTHQHAVSRFRGSDAGNVHLNLHSLAFTERLTGRASPGSRPCAATTLLASCIPALPAT